MAHLVRQILPIAISGVTVSSIITSKTQTIHADDKKDNTAAKLSIYDPPIPQITIVTPPTRIEKYVAQTQAFLQNTQEKATSQLQGLTTEWVKLEEKTKTTVRATVDPSEPLLAGALYTVVLAAGGSVLTRNRGILLRTFTPILFAAGGIAWFMPRTGANIVRVAGDDEVVKSGVNKVKSLWTEKAGIVGEGKSEESK